MTMTATEDEDPSKLSIVTMISEELLRREDAKDPTGWSYRGPPYENNGTCEAVLNGIDSVECFASFSNLYRMDSRSNDLKLTLKNTDNYTVVIHYTINDTRNETFTLAIISTRPGAVFKVFASSKSDVSIFVDELSEVLKVVKEHENRKYI